MDNWAWIISWEQCLPGSCRTLPGYESFWSGLVLCAHVAGPGTSSSQWSITGVLAAALCSEACVSLQMGEEWRAPNVLEVPWKWEPWMNSWAYWSTSSLCILTFIISVGCWCSWLMGPGAVHPSLHINYRRGVFPVIYLTAGCDKYP